MKIFAIGDVHLSFSGPVDPEHWDEARTYKPMDIFGEEWHCHYRKIYENWQKKVHPEDLVLMPGDISWAMRLEEARHDLGFLGLLPGTIVGVAGNHDYWWQSLTRVRAALPPNMRVIQNDHLEVGGVAVCGSRGWLCPGAEDFSSGDLKIYRRELIRMENSLKVVGPGIKKTVVITHFMPANDGREKNEMIELFQQYGVSTVIYGHLHGAAARFRLPDRAWGIDFHLVSADFVGFTPSLVLETN